MGMMMWAVERNNLTIPPALYLKRSANHKTAAA